jgi:hypothetical protein
MRRFGLFMGGEKESEKAPVDTPKDAPVEAPTAPAEPAPTAA